jgi:hypothetical protein
MRPQRGRAKKLIVAFHFQFANKTAWKCDTCRASGLEQKRRCGWLEHDKLASPPIVWARKKVCVSSCPTSHITPESIAMIEEFHVWKLFGASDVYRLPARLVEAIFVLENELRSEGNDAEN